MPSWVSEPSEKTLALGSSVNRGNPSYPLTDALQAIIVTVGTTHWELWVFEPLGKAGERRKQCRTCLSATKSRTMKGGSRASRSTVPLAKKAVLREYVSSATLMTLMRQ